MYTLGSKKKKKMTLFTDNMIISAESPNESTKKTIITIK